jgi:protein-S-isoprenylcysteine O-methyltransferase Ste14
MLACLMLALHSFCGLSLFLRATPGAFICGVAECAIVYCGLLNWRTASAVDSSAWGALVPLSYLVGGLIAPRPPAGIVGDMLLGLSGLGVLWCLWHLRAALSVGQPTFTRIVETGPFAYVRHPIAACMILRAAAVVVLSASLVEVITNSCALVVCGVVAGYAAEREEFFLSRHSQAYIDYACRVRWQLFPRLF